MSIYDIYIYIYIYKYIYILYVCMYNMYVYMITFGALLYFSLSFLPYLKCWIEGKAYHKLDSTVQKINFSIKDFSVDLTKLGGKWGLGHI